MQQNKTSLKVKPSFLHFLTNCLEAKDDEAAKDGYVNLASRNGWF